jgi:hypothetical protein
MSDMPALFARRDRQVARHQQRSHTNAAIYEARHALLRRAVRRERIRYAVKTIGEAVALSIFIGAILLAAGVVALPV